MNVLTWLREYHKQTVVYECRNCGTTLETNQDSCPYCETDEVAVFEIN